MQQLVAIILERQQWVRQTLTAIRHQCGPVPRNLALLTTMYSLLQAPEIYAVIFCSEQWRMLLGIDVVWKMYMSAHQQMPVVQTDTLQQLMHASAAIAEARDAVEAQLTWCTAKHRLLGDDTNALMLMCLLALGRQWQGCSDMVCQTLECNKDIRVYLQFDRLHDEPPPSVHVLRMCIHETAAMLMQ